MACQPAPRIVLVTRPEPGLSESLAEVQALGWEALACPVMGIIPNIPAPPFSCRAIAITSAHALPFLACQPKERLLLTVGKKTALRARLAGFTQIRAASGSAEMLAALCRLEGLDDAGLLFACGRGWKGQLYGKELADSLGAQWVEAYRVRRCTEILPVVRNVLVAEEVAAILFYSSETVAAFMALCPYLVRQALQHCRALCFSEAIAKRAVELATWREVALVRTLGVYKG